MSLYRLSRQRMPRKALERTKGHYSPRVKLKNYAIGCLKRWKFEVVTWVGENGSARLVRASDSARRAWA